MDVLFLILIFILAGLAGFSISRGSICLVRAAYELISGKPPRTILFILEGMTVSLAITVPAILFFPEQIKPAISYQISLILISGSIIYGTGAAINGGCALGTLNHLMNGKLNYIGTIAGIATGVFTYLLTIYFLETEQKHVTSQVQGNSLFLVPVLITVWVVIGLRVYKFKEKNIRKHLKDFITSPVARDLISVFILGASSGVLYLILGHSWDYTRLIILSEEILFHNIKSKIDLALLVVTVSGLVCGVAIATKLAKSFRFIRIDIQTLSKKFIGGLCMGIGACLIPGGNDTLIFYGLPGIALHAPVAMLFIMIAIAAVLKINYRSI